MNVRHLFILLLTFVSTTAFKPLASNISADEAPYFVKTKNTKLSSFSTSKIDIASEAVFFNTYNVGAKLLEVNIDVYMDDTKLGTVTEVQDVKIPKKSTFDIPLNLSIKPGPTALKLVTGSAKILFGKKVNVRYTGYIKIRALGMVPLKINMDETEAYDWDDLFPKEEK